MPLSTLRTTTRQLWNKAGRAAGPMPLSILRTTIRQLWSKAPGATVIAFATGPNVTISGA